MAFYPFPNQKLELGSAGRFVSDLQRELGIAVTGVFDFLTMCKVALHKFENGLNHNDPSVDHETWNSVFNKGNTQDPAAPTPTPETENRAGVAEVGQVPRTEEAQAAQHRDDENTTFRPQPTAAPTPTPDPGESLAAQAKAAPGPDSPDPSQPTITAAEQHATGGPAGGYSAAPTEVVNNQPTPGAEAAGVTSADHPEHNV